MRYILTAAILLGLSASAQAKVVQVVVDGTNYTFVCDRIHGCIDTSLDINNAQDAKRLGQVMDVAFAPMEYDACAANPSCAEARENMEERHAQQAVSAKLLAEAKAHRKVK